MKIVSNFFKKRKDGGPDSPVDAYFLIESKMFFTIALLKFNKGAREQFHTHAFDAFTWFLKGDLVEEDINGTFYKYKRSLLPKLTRKDKNHRVKAKQTSWCFTIRGPWQKTWTEDDVSNNITTTFTSGREIVQAVKRY